MAADGKVPIRESVRAGYAFMRGSWRVIAPAAAVMALFAALAGLLAPRPLAPTPAWFMVMLLMMVAGAVYAAMLFRLALRSDVSGALFGLRAGRDEANLIGAQSVVLFFSFIVAVLWSIVFGVIMNRAAAEAGIDLATLQPGDEAAAEALVKTPSAPLLAVMLLIGMGLALWLSTRLCLVAAATIGEGRIMACSTWKWTKGNVLPILAATILTGAPLFLLVQLIGGVLAAAAGQTASALQIAVDFLLLFLTNMTVTPAMAGLAAHLYRGLRPPNLSTQENAR